MPRTEKQNEKIRNRRKKKIIEESLHLFAMKGYKSVSIDDITKNVGCTHSLVYHYYESKEDIYRDALKLAKEKLFGFVDSTVVIDIYSPAQVIRTILSKILEGLKGKNRKDIACSLILVLNTAFSTDKVTEEVIPPHKRPWQMFNKIIQDGQAKNEFYEGNSNEYTVILLSFIRGVSLASLSAKDKFIVPEVEMLMRILVKEERNV